MSRSVSSASLFLATTPAPAGDKVCSSIGLSAGREIGGAQQRMQSTMQCRRRGALEPFPAWEVIPWPHLISALSLLYKLTFTPPCCMQRGARSGHLQLRARTLRMASACWHSPAPTP